MKRFACPLAAYAAALGMLCAQQPGPAPTPAPTPPKVAEPAAEPAQPEAGGGRLGPGPGTERGRRREGVPGGQQGVPGVFMERLRQERPELHKRLSKLYQENREAFFEEIRDLMRDRAAQAPEGANPGNRGRRDSIEEQKCSELGRQYRDSKDAADKERIKAELAAAIQAAFEARLRGSQERVARLEKQLREFRERLESLEANRDKICAERLDELTKPAELRWEGNW